MHGISGPRTILHVRDIIRNFLDDRGINEREVLEILVIPSDSELHVYIDQHRAGN